MSQLTEPGRVGWIDLTVDDAPRLRDFYARVAGWVPQPVPMGGYDDFSMTHPKTGESVVGVCHRRGPNEHLPPVWMIYINVVNLEAALAQVEAAGGKILRRPTQCGPGSMATIEDPSGVVSALYEPA